MDAAIFVIVIVISELTSLKEAERLRIAARRRQRPASRTTAY